MISCKTWKADIEREINLKSFSTLFIQWKEGTNELQDQAPIIDHIEKITGKLLIIFENCFDYIVLTLCEATRQNTHSNHLGPRRKQVG